MKPDARQSPIVSIQPQGEKTPWFCVHPAGGQVHWFFDLAKGIGKRRPFYGIQSPGLQDPRLIESDRNVLAARYVEAMRGIQPKGPYHLAGWSVGGSIAFHMAQLLAAAGERVARLVLIDAINFAHDAAGDYESQRAGWIATFVTDLIGSLGVSASRNLAWLDKLTEVAAPESFALDQLTAAKLLPAGLTREHLEISLNVFMAHTRVAYQAFQPATYEGEVVLIRADETAHAREQKGADACFGWQPYCKKPVRTYDLEGNHYSIFRRERVGMLASIMIGLGLES